MKAKLACLSLAAFALASCDKSGKNTDPGNTPSVKPQVENRANAPSNTGKPAHGAIDSTAGHPADAAITRPADTLPAEASSEPLTPGQMIAKFNTSGIAGVPKDVADTILSQAARAETPEEQVRFITEQSTAWLHIEAFKESVNDIPVHMKLTLLERLFEKHGDSWKDMATELDEQVAASVKVMELRLQGIPGMSADESQNLLIQALEKYGPDYKTILSTTLEPARK